MANKIFISDTHFPYQHRDALDFIDAVINEYSILENYHVGDVVDHHFSSFHEVEPGTLSAEEEFSQSYDCIQELNEICGGALTVTVGNHDEIPVRKAKAAGLAREAIKDYNSLYDVDWDWTDKAYIKGDSGDKILITHSISTSTKNNAQNFSHCSVQGHYHHEYCIQYAGDTEVLRWAMTVGCLIDPKHPAFNYSSRQVLKRPVLGLGCEVEGRPILVPMRLTKSGRWNKRV